MIPRLKPFYNHRELLAALRLGRGNIPKYEKAFAEKFECKHGVMFPYGRTALYALLKLWGLEKTEVICPAYTCVVVQHAIMKSDNIPVFVDCAEGSFNMSYEEMEEAFTDKTRAVVVTHLFGYAMDVERIQKMVEAQEKKYGHKIYVIQDVAHSYGAKWEGKLVTAYGDVALFGCNISKIINSIFGGMLITKDAQLAEQLKTWRGENLSKGGFLKSFKRLLYLIAVMFAFNPFIYGIVYWMERKGLLDIFVKYYDEAVIDMPSDWHQQATDIEARVGLVQLRKYDDIIARRQALAQKYISEYVDNQEFTMLDYDPGCTYSHVVALVEDREACLEEFQKKGIHLGILVEYSVPYMKSYEGYRRKEYPISRYYAERTINFPNWPGMA